MIIVTKVILMFLEDLLYHQIPKRYLNKKSFKLIINILKYLIWIFVGIAILRIIEII